MAISAQEVSDLNVGSIIVWTADDGEVPFLKVTAFDEDNSEIKFWVSPNLTQYDERAFTDDAEFLAETVVLYSAADLQEVSE